MTQLNPFAALIEDAGNTEAIHPMDLPDHPVETHAEELVRLSHNTLHKLVEISMATMALSRRVDDPQQKEALRKTAQAFGEAHKTLVEEDIFMSVAAELNGPNLAGGYAVAMRSE